MNFRRFIDIMTVVFALVVLAAVFLHSCQRQRLKAEISEMQTIPRITQSEIFLLNKALDARKADDCKLERTWYGFRCVEFKTGKVFRVFI